MIITIQSATNGIVQFELFPVDVTVPENSFSDIVDVIRQTVNAGELFGNPVDGYTEIKPFGTVLETRTRAKPSTREFTLGEFETVVDNFDE